MTGPRTGTRLTPFPVVETTWADWKRQHPGTLVLSLETGHRRRYDSDPYGIRAGRALGVLAGDGTKVYPFDQLRRVDVFPLRDRVGDEQVLIYFEEKTGKAWATDLAGRPVGFFLTYLRAWESFYPGSAIFRAE